MKYKLRMCVRDYKNKTRRVEEAEFELDGKLEEYIKNMELALNNDIIYHVIIGAVALFDENGKLVFAWRNPADAGF